MKGTPETNMTQEQETPESGSQETREPQEESIPGLRTGAESPTDAPRKFIAPQRDTKDWGQELAAHMETPGLTMPPGLITIGVYQERLGLSITMCRSSSAGNKPELLTGLNHRTASELQELRNNIAQKGGTPHELTISHAGISIPGIAVHTALAMAPIAALSIILTMAGQHPALALGATLTAGAIWAALKTTLWTRQIGLAQRELIKRCQSFQSSQEPPTTASAHSAPMDKQPNMLINITPEPSDPT